MLPQAP